MLPFGSLEGIALGYLAGLLIKRLPPERDSGSMPGKGNA
jgi:hypothetical protein